MGDLYVSQELVDSKLYRSILGKVMYVMTSTRPDIAFAVSTLAKFSSAPTVHHLAMAMKLIRYLKSTISMCLYYPNKHGKEITFKGYTDSNYASPLDDYKSVTGYVFQINEIPITWCSKHQTSTAVSLTEAEYVYIREKHESNEVCLEYINTSKQAADIFTKLYQSLSSID